MIRRIITAASRGRGLAARVANSILRRVATIISKIARTAISVGSFLAGRGHILAARAESARAILQQKFYEEMLVKLTTASTPAAIPDSPPIAVDDARADALVPAVHVPSDAVLNNNLQLAEHLVSASRLSEAIRFLELHIEKKPGDTAVSIRLADLYLRVGAPILAREVLVAAADAAPNDAAINTKAATLIYDIFRIGILVNDFSSRFGEGEPSALTRFLRDEFNMASSRDTLVRLLGRVSTMPVDSSNRYQVARAQLLLGMFFYATGDNDRAAQAFEITANSGINFPWCGYMQGQLAERAGQDAAAIRAYERSVMGHPRFAPAHERLGHLFKNTGSVELAAIHFDAALEGIRIGTEILGSDTDLEQASVRLQLRMKQMTANFRKEKAS